MVIYITENLINGKKYIGKDTQNKKNYLGSGKLLKIAIKKYGKDNFKKTIIEFCKDNKQLSEREIYWINFFDAVNDKNYYNISFGGDGGDTFSSLPERQKIKNILIKSENGKNRVGSNIKEEFIKKRGCKINSEKDWQEYQTKRKIFQKKAFLNKEKKTIEIFGDEVCELYKTKNINDIYETLNKQVSKNIIKKILKKFGIKIKQKKGVNSGEKNGMSKLSANRVLEIKEKYKEGNYTYKKLSLEYSMSVGQIGQLIRGETYKNQ